MAKVMVVDDVSFMRTMLKDIVTECGHTVVAEAGSGGEAIRLYADVRPDLVTMDVTMPDMDGVAALKQILHMDAKARVIMCSAVGQQKIVLEAIMSGAKDYILKPFQRDTVSQAVEQAMHRSPSGLMPSSYIS